MSDLISRDALIKAFESHGLEWRHLKMLNPILEEVDKQPFVIEKPKERTAKVIHRQETHIVTPPKSTTAEYKTETNLWTECGNCGAKGMYHGWNYCPKCGVKLDWSGNE